MPCEGIWKLPDELASPEGPSEKPETQGGLCEIIKGGLYIKIFKSYKST